MHYKDEIHRKNNVNAGLLTVMGGVDSPNFKALCICKGINLHFGVLVLFHPLSNILKCTFSVFWIVKFMLFLLTFWMNHALNWHVFPSCTPDVSLSHTFNSGHLDLAVESQENSFLPLKVSFDPLIPKVFLNTFCFFLIGLLGAAYTSASHLFNTQPIAGIPPAHQAA